jgi:hypothetical protein
MAAREATPYPARFAVEQSGCTTGPSFSTSGGAACSRTG